MSNNLLVTVGEFKAQDGSVTEFGYTASDNYGRDYNFQWDCAEAFYQDHPTPATLWAEILETDVFDSIDYECDDNGLPIIGESNCPVQSEDALGKTGFSLSGFNPKHTTIQG